MAYLLDTNVISEARKGTRCNWGVREFFDQTADSELFLPVQVIGEIRAGIANAARRGDRQKAEIYGRWLDTLLQEYDDRIIKFDTDCAQLWGTLLSGEKKDPHTIDKQIAAIALLWGMTLVTRDSGGGFTKIVGLDLKVVNPFKTAHAVSPPPPSLPNEGRFGRRNRGNTNLILTELSPNTVVDCAGDENSVISLSTSGKVREACPKCHQDQLRLVLRQAAVRTAHLFCANCKSCFDAHYANGASALTI
ncbi:MAG: VapC toxin family domain ribonuclease [Massilia sp.]|jgi:predicted nucleic acid-binding protein|nr:VapC toxin family domain ribonuclease [Massilia sp.]